MDEFENAEYGRCEATAKSTGERCRNPAVSSNGKCRMHGGTSPGAPSGNENAEGNAGGSPPELNANAETHGLTADKMKWFARQAEETQASIRELHERWLEHADNPAGSASILFDAAINEFRLGEAGLYLDEHGFVTEGIVDYDKERGETIVRERESPALLPRDRLQRTTLRILKGSGVLSGDESAAGTIVVDGKRYKGLASWFVHVHEQQEEAADD